MTTIEGPNDRLIISENTQNHQHNRPAFSSALVNSTFISLLWKVTNNRLISTSVWWSLITHSYWNVSLWYTGLRLASRKTTREHGQYECNQKDFKDSSDSCVIAALMNLDSLLPVLWLTLSSWCRISPHNRTVLLLFYSDVHWSPLNWATADVNLRCDEGFCLSESKEILRSRPGGSEWNPRTRQLQG